MGFPSGSAVEESTCNARDTGLIPGWEKFPGGRHANPLQCSCLENPMDREAWWATVHRVTKSWIRLKQLSTRTCIVGNSASQILIYDIIKRKVAPPTVETVNYYELIIHKMSDTSRVAVFPLILKNNLKYTFTLRVFLNTCGLIHSFFCISISFGDYSFPHFLILKKYF